MTQKERSELNKEYIKIFITSAVTAIIMSLLFAQHNFNKGYKQGQIDAIQGKIKFVLEKEDIWKQKE